VPNESANSENAPGADPDASTLVGPVRDAKQQLYAECVERLNNSARGLTAKIALAAASSPTEVMTTDDYLAHYRDFTTTRSRNVSIGKPSPTADHKLYFSLQLSPSSSGRGLDDPGAVLTLWTINNETSKSQTWIGTRQDVELTNELDTENPLLIATTHVWLVLTDDYVPKGLDDTLMSMPWTADELPAPNFFDSGPRWFIRLSQERALLPEEIFALAHEVGTAVYNNPEDEETDLSGGNQHAKFENFATMLDQAVTMTAFFRGTKVMDQAVIKWDQLGYLRRFVDGSGGLASLLADAADAADAAE
jgi:hypothetical protein